MTIFDHPKHLLDAWSVCETLRRLGFSPDDMAAGFGPVVGVGDDVLYIKLEVDGAEFIAGAAAVEGGNAESALAGWDALWEDVMGSTDEELAVAMSRSICGEYARIVRLAAELVARGFEIPSLTPGSTSSLVVIVPLPTMLSRGGSA